MSNIISLFDRKHESAFMTRSLLLEAFLRRRLTTFRTLSTVSVSFNSELEAEEFHRLLKATKKTESRDRPSISQSSNKGKPESVKGEG